jgi:hypothetical protein
MHKYLFFLFLSILIFTGCSDNSRNPVDPETTSLSKKYGNYSVHLDGRQEVPFRETRAQGQAIFRLSKDGTELYYKLIVANIYNVFQAHIHLGAPGVNGGVVAWLYPSSPPPVPIPGRFSGVLAEGVITDADLVGALAGMTLADLLAHFENSNAYINVHTNDFIDPPDTGPGDFPGGEIRGDISP